MSLLPNLGNTGGVKLSVDVLKNSENIKKLIADPTQFKSIFSKVESEMSSAVGGNDTGRASQTAPEYALLKTLGEAKDQVSNKDQGSFIKSILSDLSSADSKHIVSNNKVTTDGFIDKDELKGHILRKSQDVSLITTGTQGLNIKLNDVMSNGNTSIFNQDGSYKQGSLSVGPDAAGNIAKSSPAGVLKAEGMEVKSSPARAASDEFGISAGRIDNLSGIFGGAKDSFDSVAGLNRSLDKSKIAAGSDTANVQKNGKSAQMILTAIKKAQNFVSFDKKNDFTKQALSGFMKNDEGKIAADLDGDGKVSGMEISNFLNTTAQANGLNTSEKNIHSSDGHTYSTEITKGVLESRMEAGL